MNSIKSFAVKNSKVINIVLVIVSVAAMVAFGQTEFFMKNPVVSIIAGVGSVILVSRISKFTNPVTTTK